MAQTENIVEEEVNVDDFLPIPGAESIVTGESDERTETPAKKSIFQRGNEQEDMSFLQDKPKVEPKVDETEEEKQARLDAEKLEINSGEANDVIDSLAGLGKTGEPKDVDDKTSFDKGDKNMVKAFSKLIEDGQLLPFDDDKDLADYSAKDWQELITENINAKEQAVKQNTPKEFFDALPEELKYAAMHVANGNTDLKSVFKSLAEREEVRELDPKNEDHQEMIARQYLQASGYGSGDKDMIEDQVQDWIDTGSIGKKASQFKPKLDKMQEEILQSNLEKQEKSKELQVKQKEAYMDNIYNTLKPAELNGIKLDNKRQNMLWNELTTVKYESINGRPTNLLGKLLEDYQFGKEPRYDLIAETLWLLQDPDDYKDHIRQQAKNEVVKDTAKTLKTEEGRKLKSTMDKSAVETEDTKIKKKPSLKRRQTNIFKR